jgi:hypothetical protein
MKAIINGKRYDTEKATLVGETTQGYQGDFNRWEAGLYVTPRSKAYFLAGRGGAMTRFARPDEGGGYTGSSRILPMDADEALEWAAAHLTVDEVEAQFGDAIEDA